MKTIQKIKDSLVLLLLVMIQAQAQTPLATDFTYQGELTFNNQKADGLYDFEISAFDALTAGDQNGSAITIEAVEVNNGIFTLNLDFGDSAFVGNEVYLEINVRENNSGQAFNLLSPRQKITNTPYAIHAQFVGANAVTSDEILDGSITTQELADNSVNSNKIAANSVGTSEIINTQVQQRVNGSCAAGQYIQSVNENGSVNCTTDNTGLMSVTSAELVDGTIASIDIADNAITGIKIATNSIDSTKLQNNSIGENKIIPAQVQTRVAGSCSFPEYLTGINQDGSVVCQRLPLSFEYLLDTTDSVGLFTSIVVGPDELPIISYYDSTNEDLKVVKCTSVSCSSFNTPLTLDSAGIVGVYTSMVIGTDGMPIISYYDGTNGNLKVVKCTTSSCSGFNTPLTLDSTENVGAYTSIGIGTDGLPIISYQDQTNFDLKVVKCTTASCSSFNTPLTLDSNDEVGGFSSIAIGMDGLPIISYFDDTNDDLKVVKCTNASCSSFNTPLILDSMGEVGQSTSIAIGTDGLPIISYFDFTNGNLKVLKCTTTSCSTFNSPLTTIDSTGTVGAYNSIAIGSDDLPIISYWDGTNADLKLVKCTTVSCSGFKTPLTLDSTGLVGFFPSIAIGSDGLPIISYWDAINGDLKLYSCGDVNCER